MRIRNIERNIKINGFKLKGQKSLSNLNGDLILEESELIPQLRHQLNLHQAVLVVHLDVTNLRKPAQMILLLLRIS